MFCIYNKFANGQIQTLNRNTIINHADIQTHTHTHMLTRAHAHTSDECVTWLGSSFHNVYHIKPLHCTS